METTLTKAERSHSRGMLVFSVVWGGQLVSTLGSGLTSFALGIYIYEQTGSATLFAVNLLVWILPNIALSPLAGVLADRWDRRLVMMLSDSGAGLSSLFVIVMLLGGDLQVWHVYLATFFNSAFSAFQWPAYSAATSLLVPKEQLGRAGGMKQVGEAISQLATPAAAGALFVTTGLKTILLIDVLSYLAALTTLAIVRFPQPKASEEGQASRGSFWKEAFYGWGYIRRRSGLLGLLIVFACINFLLNLIFPLLTPMLLDMTSPDKVGLVGSIGGLGMLVGTLAMSAWGGPKRRLYGIYVAETLAGFSALLTGLRPSIPLIAAAGAGMLIALPFSSACSQAIWQSKVAADMQGRVFSIRSMIAFSIIPLAYALAGPLAENVFEPAMAAGGRLAPIFGPLIGVGPGRGIGLMFVICGLLYMLAASALLIMPRIRRLEIELPDAIEPGEA
ncbi:MAG: MFS transporter [Anaerolineales bacterium]|nr:MFS transporter [Anaerolineales bacterium]